jgi:hypothetical protein
MFNQLDMHPNKRKSLNGVSLLFIYFKESFFEFDTIIFFKESLDLKSDLLVSHISASVDGRHLVILNFSQYSC